MKKETELSQKFLLEMKQELLARQQSPYPKGLQARKAAEQIIKMLPHTMLSEVQHPNNFHQLVRLPIYFYNNRERILPEPFDAKDRSELYKIFEKESIPYYLCQYLYALGCGFGVWLGLISVCNMGSDWAKDFLTGSQIKAEGGATK